MKKIDWIDIEKQYETGVYPKRGIRLVRGRGARLWDSEGKVYVDAISGLGVAALGHGHPAVTRAVIRQLREISTVSNLFYSRPRAELMQQLTEVAPDNLKRVFLCNSGTESVEAALKFARFTTGKKSFICAENGFHGRTLGALSATHRPDYRNDFEPLIPGFTFVRFNDFEAVRRAIDKDTAGVLLEVVQGEGGVHPADAQYLNQVRDLCHEKGVLLILDEVQSGLCRTGRWFACQHYNVQPDILCVGKSLGGGMPIGGILMSEAVHIGPSRHGSTFGGNPLASAAAVAVLKTMASERLDTHAESKGAYFAGRLAAQTLPPVKTIRQLGLMIGIELKSAAGPYVMKLQERGVLVFTAGPNVIRLLPPLIIKHEELDQIADALIECLSSMMRTD